MPVDAEELDPKKLADAIEPRLQPGNDPRFPWVPFDLTWNEWKVLLAKARS